jgi:hypothetical protein
MEKSVAETDKADFFFVQEFTVVVQVVTINFIIQNLILVFKLLNYSVPAFR